MTDTQHFSCPSCGRQSEYEDRHTAVRTDARTTPSSAEQTRTYTCQHCGKPAAIKMNRSGWDLVDAWVKARKSP